jgi:apolipoprotein N-acyltransferase
MTMPPGMRSHLPGAAAVLSGVLLAAAFPPLECPECAWVALAPLILAARVLPPGRAFRWGWLGGTVFWLISIHWLHHVTWAGYLGLCAYNALYIGAFAAAVSRLLDRWGARRWWVNLGSMLMVVAFWISLEFLRSTLFTGFPWNTLAISQYATTTLRQLASWSGVYGVSAVLVLFNAALALTILRYREGGARCGHTAHPELMLGLLAMALAFVAGAMPFRASPAARHLLRVGLVQTGIPQPDKWSPDTVELIYQRLRRLTSDLHRGGETDLIIWPETALPDELRYSEASYQLVKDLARAGTPLLVGTMDSDAAGGGPPKYFNSSFLFLGDGTLSGVYDKRHLVMFGEYVPLERFLPFINAMTPIQASFTAGETSTVFRLEQPGVSFSSLICFEDTVAYIARDCVRHGARLLVNQTNDAWFERSAASRQHMAHCVFRCVENRVPAVRCANTGVTCHIDEFGIVREEFRHATGSTFEPGTLCTEVRVPPVDMPLTFYTRRGDVVAWAGLSVACLYAAALLGAERRALGTRMKRLVRRRRGRQGAEGSRASERGSESSRC